MRQGNSTNPGHARNPARVRSVLHAGVVCPLSRADGERLLALADQVRMGVADPQPFTFRPHGWAADEPVTIFVTPEDSFRFLTPEDGHPPR
jgi:hypothetical protein